MTAIPNLGLNDGRTIPQFGFGVCRVPPEVQRSEAGRLGPHPDTFDWIPGHG